MAGHTSDFRDAHHVVPSWQFQTPLSFKKSSEELGSTLRTMSYGDNKELMIGMLGPFLLFTGMLFSPIVGKYLFPPLPAQEGQCVHTWKGKGDAARLPCC